jgi:uncharacterized membrane protein
MVEVEEPEGDMKMVVAYFAAAAAFLVLDLLWLGYVASGFYRSELGPLLAESVNISAALVFYALFPVGLMIFAVGPALESGGVPRAFLLGALFGFFAYATYDLTNLATLKGFSLRMALVDMAWDGLLAGTSAAAGSKAAELF